MSPRVILLNGAPCSGKTTLGRALQATLGTPWMLVELDVFQDMLPPPREDWQGPWRENMARACNEAVAAMAMAGVDMLVEVVVRRNNPGASLVLLDLVTRIRGCRMFVVCLRCTRTSALDREKRRPAERRGLVDRDHGSVDEESCDLLLDTDLLRTHEQVVQVSALLDDNLTTSSGAQQLRRRLGRELNAIGDKADMHGST